MLIVPSGAETILLTMHVNLSIGVMSAIPTYVSQLSLTVSYMHVNEK